MDYYTWKSIASAPACRAIRSGAEIWPLPIAFSSGAYAYTHGLSTKRGTCYVVCKQVMRDVEHVLAEMRAEAVVAGPAAPTTKLY